MHQSTVPEAPCAGVLLRLLIAAAAALLVVAHTAAQAPSRTGPRVGVTGGIVEGRLAENGALVFQGIPYAAPPTGARRWVAPQPVRRWRGLRDATRVAPSCPQPDQGWNAADAARAQEDCLTLDIRTPSLTGRRPVMVWVHGGSNRAGSAGGTVESRITDRGVVLVAIQYRLGILGFLAPRGAGVGVAAGNYGLMDQIAALRWVQDNIVRFGGDPANVTLFGESAGSQDVSLLLAAPAAHGLFARAILQSGTPGFGQPFRTLTEGHAIADQAQRLAGADDLADLRALPVERLLAIDGQLHDPAVHDASFLWLKTTVDGAVLPASPRDLLRHAPPRPIILGSNRAEFGPAPGASDVDATLARVFGARAPEARALYDFNGAGHDPRLGHPALEIETDWVFRCPTITLATLLARQGWPVWAYEFDRSDDGGLTRHGAEIGFVMDGREIVPGGSLQDYWIGFARAGVPQGAALPAWPRFTAADRAFLAVTPVSVTIGRNPRAQICGLRDEI